MFIYVKEPSFRVNRVEWEFWVKNIMDTKVIYIERTCGNILIFLPSIFLGKKKIPIIIIIFINRKSTNDQWYIFLIYNNSVITDG